MRLDVKNVHKAFQSNGNMHNVLENINLTVHEGQFVTLLGPSGCGKTTLLTIIAGFQSPSAGEVQLNEPAFNARQRAKCSSMKPRLLPQVLIELLFSRTMPSFPG